MAKAYRTLTEADVNHFIEKGHIILRDCFPRELAEAWRAFAFKRLGYDSRRSGDLEGTAHSYTLYEPSAD